MTLVHTSLKSFNSSSSLDNADTKDLGVLLGWVFLVVWLFGWGFFQYNGTCSYEGFL